MLILVFIYVIILSLLKNHFHEGGLILYKNFLILYFLFYTSMYPLKTKAPYNPNNLEATANIYTTMYLGNYVTGNYEENVWSHPWVDIMPAIKNDNVYACLPWSVEFAWANSSNGNYIVLRHPEVPDPCDLSKTTTLFSNHLHLSELNVMTWDIIDEWDIIGKSWNTGNSTWEHLHFQIDTESAPFHPYWPFTYKEASDAGFGFFEAVNNAIGIENARKYTVNPLVYLDRISAHKSWINSPEIHVSTKPDIHLSQPQVFQNKSKYFNDISENISEIDYLYEAWVTKGYSDWTFRPEGNITRSELLIMVYKFKKLEPTGNWISFSDVSSSDFAYPYISSASSKWYISWYPDGTFKPNSPITRAETIAIALNIIIGKNNISTPSESNFQDVSLSDWYCKYTNYISENWLLDVVGKFYPNDNMKRKDLAMILYNLK